MNPHIELVKKWLADSESVSLEELKENKKAAWSASSSAVGYAVYAAAYTAYDAAWADDDGIRLTHWITQYRNEAIKHVKKYEELTK